MRHVTSAWALAGVLVLSACEEVSDAAWEPCAHLTAEPLNECSGIVRSRSMPGIFWVHNDSGDMPRLFAVNAQGELRAEVHIDGADHIDWEDIAADDHGNLYIGDFGNNDNERVDLVVYVVPEPQFDPTTFEVRRVDVSRSIPFYYPEQKAFPDRNDKNYDCEAMYWDAGSLYLLTKHRSDRRTVMYRVPLEGEGRRAAERRGEFDLGSQVTAADLSPDGQRLIVLSYEYICVFERPGDSDQFFAGRHHRVLIEGRQCEGISFDGERVVFTNEQREMYCLQLDDLLQRETYLPATPHVDVPRWSAEAADAFASGCTIPLRLGADALDTDPGSVMPPTLKLAWSPDGLYVSVRWSDLQPLDKGSRKLMQLMLGPPGDEPRLGPDQIVWELRETSDGVRMRRARPKPKGDWLDVESKREGSQLEFHARIPAPTQPNAELAFNAITFVPRSDLEWCWSTSSSAQPDRNPILWGRLRLAP